MCIFSLPIEDVSGTCIFTRMRNADHQALVYSMELGAKEEVAMILPIPGDEVEFVDLTNHKRFFEDLEALFSYRPMRALEAQGRGGGGEERKRLQVHMVGSFEASFVPKPEDFDRLDPRFALPKAGMDVYPVGFGFVVFKLTPGAGTRHPMAFSFRTREKNKVRFTRKKANAFFRALLPMPSHSRWTRRAGRCALRSSPLLPGP